VYFSLNSITIVLYILYRANLFLVTLVQGRRAVPRLMPAPGPDRSQDPKARPRGYPTRLRFLFAQPPGFACAAIPEGHPE
jgi:hypothetical protein